MPNKKSEINSNVVLKKIERRKETLNINEFKNYILKDLIVSNSFKINILKDFYINSPYSICRSLFKSLTRNILRRNILKHNFIFLSEKYDSNYVIFYDNTNKNFDKLLDKLSKKTDYISIYTFLPTISIILNELSCQPFMRKIEPNEVIGFNKLNGLCTLEFNDNNELEFYCVYDKIEYKKFIDGIIFSLMINIDSEEDLK